MLSFGKLGKSFMAQPRTIKTLSALVVCMTLGTLALVAMQTEPIRSPLFELAAVRRDQPDLAETLQAELPIEESRWNHIIIHDGPDRPELAERFHLILRSDPDGHMSVEASEAWKQQQTVRHTVAPGPKDWNADGIGIYVVRTGSNAAAANRVLGQLCPLLQDYCRIPSDRIYRPVDLGLGD